MRSALKSPLVIITILLIIGGAGGAAVYVLNNQAKVANDNNSSTSSSADASSAATSETIQIPQGWQQVCDSLTKVCFSLPPQDSYQAIPTSKIDQTQAKQWYFESTAYNEGGLYFSTEQKYQVLNIVRSPARSYLKPFACGHYCDSQTNVVVTIVTDRQTLDQAMKRFEDKIKVGFDVQTGASLIIANKEKVQKWKLPAYRFNILGGKSTESETYYLLKLGNKLVEVTLATAVRDDDSVSVMESLVLN